MAFTATLVLVDSMGRTTSKRIGTVYDVLATAQTDVGAYASDLAAVSDLELLHVVYSFKDTGDAFAGTGTSNVDVGATFTVITEAGAHAAHKVPGFPLSLVGGDGSIDVTQSEVGDYFANFQSPQGLTLSDGEQITGVLRGSLDR